MRWAWISLSLYLLTSSARATWRSLAAWKIRTISSAWTAPMIRPSTRCKRSRAILVARLVRDVALEDQSGQLAVVERLGGAGLDVGSPDERHRGHDQAFTALVLLEADRAAMDDAASARSQVVANALFAHDRAA